LPDRAPSPVSSSTQTLLPLVEQRPPTPAMSSSPQLEIVTSDREAFERMIGPVLDRFTAFQSQTFEQFQTLLHSVVEMFGAKLERQQEFVREEMSRFDQISNDLAELQQALQANAESLPLAEEVPVAQPEPNTPAAPKHRAPEPRLDPAAPHVDGEMHVWLQARIGELHEQRTTFWKKVIGWVRGKSGLD
jgi:hypothetical protein